MLNWWNSFQIGDLSSHNHSINEVTSVELIPVTRGQHHLTESQKREQEALEAMINQHFNTKGFYFSYTTGYFYKGFIFLYYNLSSFI